ncbi:hypothetical protein [Azospirillum doebereinerae]
MDRGRRRSRRSLENTDRLVTSGLALRLFATLPVSSTCLPSTPPSRPCGASLWSQPKSRTSRNRRLKPQIRSHKRSEVLK